MDVFDSVECAQYEHYDDENVDNNGHEFSTALGNTSIHSYQYSMQREVDSSLRDGKLFIELVDVSGMARSG